MRIFEPILAERKKLQVEAQQKQEDKNKQFSQSSLYTRHVPVYNIPILYTLFAKSTLQALLENKHLPTPIHAAGCCILQNGYHHYY